MENFSFFIILCCTVFLELILALPLLIFDEWSGYDLGNVILINCLTAPICSFLMTVSVLFLGYTDFEFLSYLVIIVPILIEGKLLRKLNPYLEGKAYLISLYLNVLSFIGFWLIIRFNII
jgi:hypothetical protein